MSRVKRVRISPEILVHTLKQASPVKIEITENALPQDAKCVGVYHDPQTNCLFLYIESETYEDLGEGYAIPSMWPPTILFKDNENE